MNICMSMLTKQLTDYRIEYYKGGGEDSDFICGINLFEEGMSSYEPDILYIAKGSDFLKLISSGSYPLNMLCINNPQCSQEVLSALNMNLIMIAGNSTINTILNNVQNYLFKYAKWTDKLLKAVNCNQGLQSIIDIGHEMINRPILLMDTTLKILAYTKNDMVDYQPYVDSVARGYVIRSAAPFDELREVAKKLSHNKRSVIVEKSSLPDPYIQAGIFVNSRIAGYMNVSGAFQPITKDDLILANHLSMIISLEMQKSELIHITKEIKHEYLIIDLLSGRVTNKDEIEDRLKFIPWVLKKNLFVLTAITNRADIIHDQFLRIKDSLSEYLPNSKSVIYEDNIVIVLNHNEKHPYSQDEYNKINSFLLKNNMMGAVSQCFHDISLLKKYYEQSLKALQLGSGSETEKILYNYSDYILLHLIDTLSDCGDLMDYCHPALFKLIHYDKINKTSLTLDLYLYIRNSLRKAITAKELHIQRSSLLYRLDKIENIMDVKLEDRETLFHLELSYELLNHARMLHLDAPKKSVKKISD